MIDSFDYKEPACALCGGKDFYNPDSSKPDGVIPVKRIIEKVDGLFNKNDVEGAGRLLEYWKAEALTLKDKRGELSICDELVGFYRKTGKAELGLAVCQRCLDLIEQLGISGTLSCATILLNIATAKKAFGQAEEALTLYEQAQKVYLRNLDDKDERLAGLYNNYALALVDTKRLAQAEELYLKALKVLSDNPKGKLDSAITYINLAYLYQAKGNGDITDCLFKAYRLLCDEALPKTGYTAYVYQNCAPAYLNFGYEKIANDLVKEAKLIYERA